MVLWIYALKPRPRGAVAGLFLLGYGLMRFTAEYFREPDSFLGLFALNMSMGQWLCMPMIVLGACFTWQKTPSSPRAGRREEVGGAFADH